MLSFKVRHVNQASTSATVILWMTPESLPNEVVFKRGPRSTIFLSLNWPMTKDIISVTFKLALEFCHWYFWLICWCVFFPLCHTLLHVPFRIDRGAWMTGRSLPGDVLLFCVRLEHVPRARQRAINEPIKGMRCVFMPRRAVNHPGLQCPRAVSRMCRWIYCYCLTIKVRGMWGRISGKCTCCKK